MANQPTKYRKFVVGAASAALVASAVAPVASAADFKDTKGNTHEDAINALVEAGIVSGYPDGSFLPNKTLTRSDVVKFMGKWLVSLGFEVPADYKTNLRFKDQTANTNDELLQYSALVKDHGVFNGYEDGTLGAAGNITRENMAIVLVRAYDAINKTDLVAFVKEQNFKKDVTDLATAKAEARPYIDVLDYFDITNPAAPQFNPKATTTRGQFASFLYKTSKAEAVAPVTTATKVESVSATNLKEIVIKFDGTVDANSAQDEDNYSTNAGTVDSAVLSEDGKTVTLTLEGSMTNQKAYKLSVSNVKAGDKTISAKDVAFSPLDNTLPVVEAVVPLGNKAVKVVMSEPVKDAKQANFKIDGKSFYGSVSTDGNEIVLKPYDATVLSVGAHKLNVSLIEDYAQLKSLTADFDFTVVEDKEGPVVTNVTATLERAVITFNEDLDPATVAATDVYWMSGTTKHRASSFTKLAGNKYAFEFTTGHTLPGYETTLYIDSVSDYSGNANATKEVKVHASVDQTRPEVSDVKVASDALSFTVKFSKNVKADNKAYYRITDVNGDIVSIKSVEQVDSKTAKITLYDKLAGKNDLRVTGVQDTTTLKNTMLEYNTTLVVGDKTPPTLLADGVTASAADRTVLMSFSEKMDLATLSNHDNYLIDFNGSVITLPQDVEITPLLDGKAVLLAFPEEINDVNVTIGATVGAGTLKRIQAQGLKDLAGNVLANYTTGFQNVVSEKAGLAAQYSTTYSAGPGVLTDQKTIKVKFTQPIVSAGRNDFKLSGVPTGVSIDSVTTDGTSVVTIKLSDNVGTDASAFTLKLSANNNIKTVAGNSVVTSGGVGVDQTITLDDAVAPVVVAEGDLVVTSGTHTVNGASVTGEFIELPFSENLATTAQAQYAHDLVIYVASDLNNALTPVTHYQTVVDGNKLLIFIPGADGDSYVVSVKNAKFIKDAKGNVAKDSDSYDSKAVDNVPTPPAAAAPTASGATITGTPKVGDTLTGSYNYNDVNGDAEGTSTFKWYASDDAAGTNKTQIAGEIGKTLVLTIAQQGKYISFEVTPVAATGTPTTGTPVESAVTAVVAP